MKKILLIIVVLMFGALSASLVSAQDEEEVPVSCDADTLVEAATVLSDGFTEYQELMVLPDEPTASDLSVAVATADAYAYGFWEGFYEALEEDGACVEVWWLGYTSGLILDEALIVTQLSALAVHEAEAGNADLADSLLTLATERSETLNVGVESVQATLAAVIDGEELNLELVECTEDEMTETWDGLTTITDAYAELGGMVEEASGTDLSALVVGYATLSGGYWSEVYPLVPACYEANDVAFTVGLILDESVIVAANLRLAEIESEMGNDDLAQALAESGATRAEELTAAIEEYFGEEEE
ncbi:MAG: hypothetical protein RLP44_08180 [Aggregatilineales bacterium]